MILMGVAHLKEVLMNLFIPYLGDQQQYISRVDIDHSKSNYIRAGASGEYTLTGFPQAGTDITVQWQESSQNFVISAELLVE